MNPKFRRLSEDSFFSSPLGKKDNNFLRNNVRCFPELRKEQGICVFSYFSGSLINRKRAHGLSPLEGLELAERKLKSITYAQTFRASSLETRHCAPDKSTASPWLKLLETRIVNDTSLLLNTKE